MASLRKADCISWCRAGRKLQLHFRAPRGIVAINAFSTLPGEKTQDSTNGHFCQQETTWGIRGEEDWKRRRVPGKQKHSSRNSHQSGVTFSSILLPVLLLLLLLSPGSCRGMASRPGPAGEAAGRAPAAPRRPEEEEAAPGPQEVRLPRARRPRPRPGGRCAVTGGGGQRRPRPRGQRPAGPFLTGSRPPRPAAHLPCPPLPCWGGGRGARRSPSSWWAAGAGRRPASSRLPSLLAWCGAAKLTAVRSLRERRQKWRRLLLLRWPPGGVGWSYRRAGGREGGGRAVARRRRRRGRGSPASRWVTGGSARSRASAQVRRAARVRTSSPALPGMQAVLPSSAAEGPPAEGGRSGITCCGGLQARLCLVTPGLARGLRAPRPEPIGPEPADPPGAASGGSRASALESRSSFTFLLLFKWPWNPIFPEGDGLHSFVQSGAHVWCN